ncbi:MAG: GAF domain-containing protein [Chloroflexi bacterium]|nr:GAF domain-containing protein [Chloroflexota bacterium]
MNLKPFAEHFWAIAGAASVRTKIMGIILALTLLFGAGITFYVSVTLEAALRKQLEIRGASIATDLAARSADLLLTNNTYALHELIRNTVENHDDLRYAFVLDGAGRLAANSFTGGFPKGLREANVVSGEERFRLEVLRTEEGWLWDIAAPIFGGRVGTARVGLSEARLQTEVASTTQQLLVATVLVSELGLIAAYLLTWILTRPVIELVNITRAVGHGDLRQRARVWANDEVGRLSTAFNSMIDDLRSARNESERYNTQLLRRNKELAALYAVASAEERPADLRQTLQGGLAAALEATGFRAGWITLLDGDRYEVVCWQGLADEIGCQEAGSIGACPCDQAVGAQKPLIIPLRRDCPKRVALFADGGHANCHATAPLITKGLTVGVLNVAAADPGVFSSEDLDLLGAIARDLARAVENARLWEELKRKEEIRGRLLNMAIDAQEEERKRVARELHDDTGQAITSLMLGIKVASEAATIDDMRGRLRELRDIAAQTLTGLRDLARDLRPSMLDDLGIKAALERYVEGYAAKFGLPVDLEIAGFTPDRRLPPHIELTVFRIIQEALTNVAKHAQARSVSVVLELRSRSVVVVIEDDGVGFDVQQVLASPLAEAHLGLHGMRERALLVGGRLALESAPGHGTTVQVEIPIETPAMAEGKGDSVVADTSG